jgi:hypothetical protein
VRLCFLILRQFIIAFGGASSSELFTSVLKWEKSAEVVMDVKSLEDARKKKNEDLLRRMRAGEDTRLYSPQDTWFPSRPVIKKDEKLVKALFSSDKLNDDE